MKDSKKWLIAPTSIPNELHRNIGTFYRQEGKLCFLIGEASQTETAGAAINDLPAARVHNNGGTHETAIGTSGLA